MGLRSVHLVTMLTPAVVMTLAVLVVALAALVLLTVVIRRREHVPVPVITLPEKVEAQRIRRATSTNVPADVQDRLRFLTGSAEPAPTASDEHVSAAPGQPATSTRLPDGAVTAAADDSTRYFGDEVTGDDVAQPKIVYDSTMRFDGQDLELAPGGDATQFFGDEADVAQRDDATQFFGDEGVASAQRDATQFFGDEGDAAQRDGATHVFGTEGTAELRDDATQFFGHEDAASEPGDATQFFGDEDATSTHDATQVFGHEAAPHAAEPDTLNDATRFFGNDGAETDDEMDAHPAAMIDGTHTLQALPPVAGAASEAGTSHFAGLPTEVPSGTGFLPALPPSAPVPDTGALGRVRERLSAVAVPAIVSISVLDGSGRVLAGNADGDVTDELRSLMAESGQGNMADLEQPVQLGDDAHGALLLVPTGSNALLGALVRESDDPDAVRAALRGLAHEIGDAMRRAS